MAGLTKIYSNHLTSSRLCRWILHDTSALKVKKVSIRALSNRRASKIYKEVKIIAQGQDLWVGPNLVTQDHFFRKTTRTSWWVQTTCTPLSRAMSPLIATRVPRITGKPLARVWSSISIEWWPLIAQTSTLAQNPTKKWLVCQISTRTSRKKQLRCKLLNCKVKEQDSAVLLRNCRSDLWLTQ